MRFAIAAFLLLAPVAAHAQDDEKRLFISPMGEPFRGGADAEPEAAWFNGADADKDGKLTLTEMSEDAARFFKLLDLNANGEIEPREMERYETVLVPEVAIRLGTPGGGFATSADAPQYGYKSGQGAALFSYFDAPQLVLSADTNFNRGVSAREFESAAQRRFKALDANSDGVLKAEELPKPRRKSRGRKR